MINFLIAVALILFVAILIVYLVRIMNEPVMYGDIADETTTTTTTTTTVTESVVEPQVTRTVADLPPLTRQFKPNGQPFVVDPVDGDEWMLNTNDDMYEDGAGTWYRLVDAPKTN